LLVDEHRARVRVASWTPDTTQLLTASDDGTLRLLDLWTSLDAMVETGILRSPRPLSQEQRNTFFLSSTPVP